MVVARRELKMNLPPSLRFPAPTFWLLLVGWLGVCYLAAFLGSVATSESVSTWLPTLNKPFFNPPGYLFGPVWSTLYTMMAVAAFMVSRIALAGEEGVSARARTALWLFAIQLILNASWSHAFFGLRSPVAGLVVIVPLWVAILWTMVRFGQLHRPAGWLLVPYLGWVSFATVLNGAFWWLN